MCFTESFKVHLQFLCLLTVLMLGCFISWWYIGGWGREWMESWLAGGILFVCLFVWGFVCLLPSNFKVKLLICWYIRALQRNKGLRGEGDWQWLRTDTCVRVCVCAHGQARTCLSACIHIWLHTNASVFVFVYACVLDACVVCVCVRVSVCVCVCLSVFTRKCACVCTCFHCGWWWMFTLFSYYDRYENICLIQEKMTSMASHCSLTLWFLLCSFSNPE